MPMVNQASRLIRIAFKSWLWFLARLYLTAFSLRLLTFHKGFWNSVDVLDFQDPIAFSMLHKAARRHKVPTILTVHGYMHHESSCGSIDSKSFWGQLLIHIEKRGYSSAKRIVTVDSRLRDYLLRLGISSQKIVVRPNSVDCEVFKPATSACREVERRRLGIRPETKTVCCVRRLEQKCGVAYAIQATKILRERGVDSVLLIAGKGSLERELRSLTSQLGIQDSVRFLGELARPEVMRLLKACDAATVPSVTVGEEVEATSISALEAMASGLPVVASNIGGLKEIIREGETGLLVPERDPSSLATAIEEVLGSKGIALGKAAREDVLARFSLEHGVQTTISLYDELLRNEV